MLLDGLRLILPFAGKVADGVSASDKAVTLANDLIECGRIGSGALNGGSAQDLRTTFKCIAEAVARQSNDWLEQQLTGMLGTAMAIADGFASSFTVIVEEMHGWNRGSFAITRIVAGVKPPPPAPPPGYFTYHVVGADLGLNFRSAPSLSASVVRKLPTGTAVQVACQVAGDSVSLYGRSTVVWNKTVQGDYASDAYFDTPALYEFSSNIPRCSGNAPPTDTSIPVATTTQFLVPPWQGGSTVNVRRSPDINAPVAYTLPTGTVVRVVCQAVGSPIGYVGKYPGNSTWDKVKDGNWIHDAVTDSPGGIRQDLGGGNFAFFSPGWPRC